MAATPPAAANAIMAAILGGALLIAVVGTFLPDLVGLAGPPAWAMRLVFYAVAAIDVAVAFWLRARLRKARETGGQTVRRQ